MSDDKQLFYMRAFLNDETGAAIVEASVTDSCSFNANKQERYVSVYGTLHITDCSRSVELDVSFNDIEGARGQLRKLDRLIDAAQGMREALARAARREWPGRKL